MSNTLLIIGAGNMGGAFYTGCKEVAEVRLLDHNPAKIAALGAALLTPEQSLAGAQAVLFAVKPQSFAACISELHTDLSDRLIISIMAGIKADTLAEATGSCRVVRAMPNLPVKVKAGVTAWYATESCTSADLELCQSLFEANGISLALKTEEQVDLITPLHGSGPAYYFLLTELIAVEAQRIGFSKEQAATVAKQTFIGSAKYLEQSDLTAPEARIAVTSKKGVTQAAVEKWLDLGLKSNFTQAIKAALQRTQELSSPSNS